MKTEYMELANRLTRSPLYRRLGCKSFAARAMMQQVYDLWIAAAGAELAAEELEIEETDFDINTCEHCNRQDCVSFRGADCPIKEQLEADYYAADMANRCQRTDTTCETNRCTTHGIPDHDTLTGKPMNRFERECNSLSNPS